MQHVFAGFERHKPHIVRFFRKDVHLSLVAVDIQLGTCFVFFRNNGDGFHGKGDIGRLQRIDAQASYLAAAPAVYAAHPEFKDGFIRRCGGDAQRIGFAQIRCAIGLIE